MLNAFPAMDSTAHLRALELRLSNERRRFSAATKASEKALRAVWIEQIEKELAAERARLGSEGDVLATEVDDDALLQELLG